ncbi:MAG: Lacal_2735 family protein [Flavobacteriaceae bacterium]|nr:Lacal_2735 family protein [Flavobacteriaceae bacterium]
MLGLFRKKSEKERLQEKYEKLQQEAYRLSTINRKLSDQKTFEAEEVMKQLEKIA